MKLDHFRRAPAALRRAKLDNVALVPASLLPYHDEYQAIANQQPPGTTLVVLPANDTPLRCKLELMATRMQGKGQSVKTVSSAACIGVRAEVGAPQTATEIARLSL